MVVSTVKERGLAMNYSFDHLVWFLKNPNEAIAPLKQRGIHVAGGGRHENWGTYNTLSYFGLSYLEFLGIENLAIAETHQENRLVTQIVEQLGKGDQEGPSRFAIRTDSIEELAAKLKEEGFKVYGPLPGERVRGDGETIKWSLLFPEVSGDHGSLPLPFFIQWEKADDERLADLKKAGLIIDGAPAFESVGFVVKDVGKTLKTWRKLFQFEVAPEYYDAELNARCVKVALPGTNLLFCEPLGDGVAERVLRLRGETPFIVNFADSGSGREIVEMLEGFWRF